MVPNVRCYNGYFLILSTFSGLFEYAQRLIRHDTDIFSKFMQIKLQEGYFEGSPRTFGTDLVCTVIWKKVMPAFVKVLSCEFKGLKNMFTPTLRNSRYIKYFICINFSYCGLMKSSNTFCVHKGRLNSLITFRHTNVDFEQNDLSSWRSFNKDK